MVLIAYQRKSAERTALHAYHSKYGKKFNPDIDSRDEMYQYFVTVNVGRSSAENQAEYFDSGDAALRSFQDILRDQGLDWKDIASMLEFASGFGRITRFLVTRIHPKKITVSDIDRAAVESNSKMFHTRPLVSVKDPSEFRCDQKFQIIFVASLFSHLNLKFWHAWLERLYTLLQPGGLLIFSTHGEDHFLPENASDLLIEDGFWFKSANETRGRLDAEIYGTTWVNERWVRECITKFGLGNVTGYYRRKLWLQDVYVIKKT